MSTALQLGVELHRTLVEISTKRRYLCKVPIGGTCALALSLSTLNKAFPIKVVYYFTVLRYKNQRQAQRKARHR